MKKTIIFLSADTLDGEYQVFSYQDISELATQLNSRNIKIGNNCHIGDSVLLYNNVTIGDGCNIGTCTTLMYMVEIGNECRVGNNVSIGNGVNISNYCVIGDGCEIGDGVFICDVVIIGNSCNIYTDVTGVGIAENSVLGVGSKLHIRELL